MPSDIPTKPQAQHRWVPILLGAIALVYLYCLLLSPSGQILPGEPVWAVTPATLQEIWDESLNFFFVLPLLNKMGLHPMEAPAVHPVSQALFNFAEAWIWMFLPLLVADPKGKTLPQLPVWAIAMFLTNVVLCPYMAVRATVQSDAAAQPRQKRWPAKVFGVTGLMVGTLAIPWGLFAQPELGDLAARGLYLGQLLTTNRVAIAFGVDLLFFAVFQAILLGAVEPQGSPRRWLRFVPFWGLAVWLLV